MTAIQHLITTITFSITQYFLLKYTITFQLITQGNVCFQYLRAHMCLTFVIHSLLRINI